MMTIKLDMKHICKKGGMGLQWVGWGAWGEGAGGGGGGRAMSARSAGLDAQSFSGEGIQM